MCVGVCGNDAHIVRVLGDELIINIIYPLHRGLLSPIRTVLDAMSIISPSFVIKNGY